MHLTSAPLVSTGYFCWCGSDCQDRHGRTLWHGYKRKTSCIYSFLWQQQGDGWISILETSRYLSFSFLFLFFSFVFYFYFCSSNSGKGHCLLFIIPKLSVTIILSYCFSLFFCQTGFLERTFTGETVPHKVCNSLFHFWISWRYLRD